MNNRVLSENISYLYSCVIPQLQYEINKVSKSLKRASDDGLDINADVINELTNKIDNLKTQLQTLNTSVGTLSKTVTTNTNTIEYVNESVGTLSNSVQQNTTDISSLNSTVGTLSNDVTSEIQRLESSMITLNSSVDNVLDNITTNVNNTALLTESVGTLSNEVSTLSSSITQYTSDINSLTETASHLSNNVGQNTADIASLTTSVGTLSSDVNTYKTNTESLTTSVGTMSNSITQATNDIESINTKIKNISKVIIQTTDDIQTINTNIGTLSNEVSTNTQEIVDINARLNNMSTPGIDEFANKNYIVVRKQNKEYVKYEIGQFDPTLFSEYNADYYDIQGVYLNNYSDYNPETFRALTTTQAYIPPNMDAIIIGMNWFREVYNTSSFYDLVNFPTSRYGNQFRTGIVIDITKAAINDWVYLTMKAGECVYERLKATPGLCRIFSFSYNYIDDGEEFVSSGPQDLLDIGNVSFNEEFTLPDAMYYRINITAPIGVRYFDFSKVPFDANVKLYLTRPATIKFGRRIIDGLDIAYCCDEPPKIISDYMTEEEISNLSRRIHHLPYTATDSA